MQKSPILSKGILSAILAMAAGLANAGVTITVTENTVLGGTDWSFSNGTGVYSVSSGFGSPIFFVGDSTSAPMHFKDSATQCGCGNLTVLAGTNVFGFQNIFAGAYSGISGNQGEIPRALDFQTFTNVGSTVDMSDLDGLVLNISNLSFGSFNLGTYSLNNYYTGYGTNFGEVTLVIGGRETVPEPASLALVGVALAAAAGLRTRKSR